MNRSCTSLHSATFFLRGRAIARPSCVYIDNNDGTNRFVSSRAFQWLSYCIFVIFWPYLLKMPMRPWICRYRPLSGPIFSWFFWERLLQWGWIVSRSIELALSFPKRQSNPPYHRYWWSNGYFLSLCSAFLLWWVMPACCDFCILSLSSSPSTTFGAAFGTIPYLASKRQSEEPSSNHDALITTVSNRGWRWRISRFIYELVAHSIQAYHLNNSYHSSSSSS